MLNGRVRNGNGCGHPGMLTGIAAARQSAGTAATYQLAAARVVFARANVASWEVRIPLLTGEAAEAGPADRGSRLAVWPRARSRTDQRKGLMRSSVRLLVPVS